MLTSVHQPFLLTMCAIVSVIEDLKRKFSKRFFKSFVVKALFMNILVHSFSALLRILVNLELWLKGTNCAQLLNTDRRTIQAAIACADRRSPCLPATTSCQGLARQSYGLSAALLKLFQNVRVSQHRSTYINNSSNEINPLLTMPTSRQHEAILGNFDGCSDGICFWNLQTNQAYYSPRWNETLGCNDAWISKITEWTKSMQQHLEGVSECVDSEHQLRREDGSYRCVRIRGRRNASSIMFVMTDVTKYKQDQEKLTREANYDDLTKLPNCKALREQLEQIQKHAQRKQDSFAVLFLDLNDFKPINDTRGHRAGDIVLQQCAKRIEEAVRPGDLAFRKGGDEFVVILKEVAVHEEVNPVIERIKEAIKQPIAIETGDPVRTSVSVGCNIVNGSEQTEIEDIIEKADQAMYNDKQLSNEQMNFVDRLNRTTNDCKHEMRGA